MKSQNKIAIVTGSSKGIGRTIATRLATEGYVVYITYLSDKSGGKNAVQDIENAGGRAHLVELDVRSEEQVKSVFAGIKKDYGHLNVLVNNAGIESPGTIDKLSFENWKLVTETKIHGNFLCTKYALPLLKNQDNANLIIINSSLGDAPDYEYPAYCTGTAGSITFTKMMAVQLGQYGIRTNSISPGTTRTPMWDEMGRDDDAMWDKFAKGNPMGRVSTPEDIANTAMMIIDDQSKYLNGNFIFANGGSHLK